jgi:amidohydrolase
MSLSANPVDSLRKLYPDMVAWRRYLHRHPELSFQETNTSGWIAERLRQFGCEFREGVGGNGIVAVIKGGRPGPTVALRADIDALPIQDDKDCDYASSTPGVMHACGHDAHTATMLGIARYYSENRETIAGERRLLFQPAEEVTPGGALPMIRDGALDGADAIYGVHLWTPIPYGTAASRAGALMAAADEFSIDITGRGGHGGLPHQAVDSIVVGASLVQALQTIVSRSVDPLRPAVVSVGAFQAGTTSNVIAERCHMKGTVRTFDEKTRDGIRSRITRIVEDTASMYGATAKLDYREGYPSVMNDTAEAERFFRVGEAALGQDAVRESELIMAGEDFCYYLQRIPGCFMLVGAGNEACGAVYPHHHPKFDLDERAMLVSARLMIAMAEDFADKPPVQT